MSANDGCGDIYHGVCGGEVTEDSDLVSIVMEHPEFVPVIEVHPAVAENVAKTEMISIDNGLYDRFVWGTASRLDPVH
ncbi:hypothetical protein [Brevibacterium limosum]|uniref:hypothetical protein n=1 Tax=Brevibacterium limosum TaxID=2697565 RepID=UPI0014219F63|nr:hypothetical protein [Brevibacterium limosum]